MPSGSNSSKIIRISPKRRIPNQKEVVRDPKRITSAERVQFEIYYDINSAMPLMAQKNDNGEYNILHKQRYLSKGNSLMKLLAEKSIDCLLDTNSQIDLYTQSWPIPNLSSRPILPVTDKKTDTENDKVKEPAKKGPQRMDWNNYHRLNVIHMFMDDLESEFPSLCTTGVIGKSLEGRDLKILKISNSNASNGCVWIDAGIHAREWIAPAVNTFVANHIARNFDSLSDSVRNKDWYFLPVVNPDGYEYSHTTNRMWRKNKANVNKQLFGVDLNRNFSHGWGGKGSSDEPKHAFYRGPRPFSEPESTAMKNVFTTAGLSFQVYITLHSFGQVIIMPYAYSEHLAPDYTKLLQGATVMSRAIFDTNGNTYKVGVSKDVMYHASGTSNDWCHGTVGIPFCYLIELRSKKHKFKLPEAEIAETGTEIVNCLMALMEFVDNYKPPMKIKLPNVSPVQSTSNTYTISRNNMTEDEGQDTNEDLNCRKYIEFDEFVSMPNLLQKHEEVGI